MSTEVSVRQSFLPTASEWERMKELAKIISNTEFVPRGLRGRPEAVLAALVAGSEIGVGPMQSLQYIAVIDGKVNYAPQLLLGKIRQAGHSVKVEYGDGAVTLIGKRSDTQDEHTVVWNMEMAAAAGLAGKKNWQQYQRSMLTWRAVTELARVLFPDLTMGLLSYTSEELGDEDVVLPDLPEGEIITDGEVVADVEDTVVLEPEPEAAPEPETVEEPPKKKRGRPRKTETRDPEAKGILGDLGLVDPESGEITGESALVAPPAPEAEAEPEIVEETHHQALREQLAKMAPYRQWNQKNFFDSATASLQRPITAITDMNEEECKTIIAVAKKYVLDMEQKAQESL